MSTSEEMAANSQENSEPRNPAEHLKPFQFQPGQSGNPKGRPARKPITDAYLKALEDPETCKRIALAAIEQAIKGNGQVLKEITDRTEGKIADSLELSGADGGPVQTRVVVEFVKPDESK